MVIFSTCFSNNHVLLFEILAHTLMYIGPAIGLSRVWVVLALCLYLCMCVCGGVFLAYVLPIGKFLNVHLLCGRVFEQFWESSKSIYNFVE